jgi:hypothetical protein
MRKLQLLIINAVVMQSYAQFINIYIFFINLRKFIDTHKGIVRALLTSALMFL